RTAGAAAASCSRRAWSARTSACVHRPLIARTFFQPDGWRGPQRFHRSESPQTPRCPAAETTSGNARAARLKPHRKNPVEIQHGCINLTAKIRYSSRYGIHSLGAASAIETKSDEDTGGTYGARLAGAGPAHSSQRMNLFLMVAIDVTRT